MNTLIELRIANGFWNFSLPGFARTYFVFICKFSRGFLAARLPGLLHFSFWSAEGGVAGAVGMRYRQNHLVEQWNNYQARASRTVAITTTGTRKEKY
jgi:hypothetical protein